MKKIKIFTICIIVLFSLQNSLKAGYPTKFEEFCIEVMDAIENKLNVSLKKNFPDYSIKKTHPSPLGSKFTNAEIIRDCWIIKNGKRILTVFVILDDIPLKNLPQNTILTKHRLKVRNAEEDQYIKIGIIAEDKNLEKHVLKVINEMDISNPPILFEY
jgi:hypothetical protein